MRDIRFEMRWAGLPVIALCAAMGTTAATAGDTANVTFDLPVQPLAASLRAVATASGTSIVAPAALLKNRIAPPVHGRLTTQAALAILLANSGLRARSVADGVIIERAEAPDPNAVGESTGDAIIVTGSRIRGGPIASIVIRRTLNDLRDQGKTDLGEVVRSIPQSYGGGQNPGVGINVPSNRGADVGGGASVNLRGLGSDATLTLLDGHRLAFNGSSQSIDVAAIPFNAVDRLEIVPDGASAIYGSDAVAGVANIILRRPFDGLEVGGRLAATSDGGGFQQQYWATGGATWTGGGVVGSYEYGSNTAITADQRDYAASASPGLTLYPAMRHHSVAAVAEQALGSGITFKLDALFNRRTSNTEFPTLPGGNLRDGRALLSFKDRSFALLPSLTLALAGNWNVTLSGTFGKERVNYHQDQCALDSCFVAGDGYYRNNERSVELGAEGALFSMPGGAARLALGAGYRRIGFQRFAVNGATVNAQHAQDSMFAYGELELPIVSSFQKVRFIDRLAVTGAVRYERYPGIGDVATPKLGIVYAPTPDFDLKGSWGKSFRAPTLYQQYSPRTVIIFETAFFGGTGYPNTAGAILVTGGNPALKPERATSWSASFGLHPRAIPGFRLEASYFNVDYRDRIVSPIAFLSQALSNPIYANQVTLAPSAAAQAAVIASAGTFIDAGPLPYDPVNTVAIIDNASVNAGRQTAHGIDLLAEYRLDLASGQTVKFVGNASFLTSAQQISASQASIPLAGRIFSPPRVRGQGSVVWSSGPLTLGSTLNYIGGVLDARTTTARRIAGMTTLDLTARYRLERSESPLGGLDFTISVSNLFNARPSLIATTFPYDTPYDSTNYSPVGRLISVGIAKKL